MKSMTGYGSASAQTDTFLMEVEVKSYNNRFLEIEHVIPFPLSPFEVEMDKAIGGVAKRGHVILTVKVRNIVSDFRLQVDGEAVRRYAEAFASISGFSGKALKPTLSDFIAAEGVLSRESDANSEKYRAALFDALSRALRQLSQSKEREGESTRRDLVRLGSIVRDGLEVIKAHADELEDLVKKNLRQRFEEMLGDRNLDEGRILQEVAVMLVKYSVNEEIKRLETHLAAYDSYLALDEPVGKRLDFLCQEMNREINTIGSKSQIAEMNLEVVKMKDGLENIREQVRNIE